MIVTPKTGTQKTPSPPTTRSSTTSSNVSSQKSADNSESIFIDDNNIREITFSVSPELDAALESEYLQLNIYNQSKKPKK